MPMQSLRTLASLTSTIALVAAGVAVTSSAAQAAVGDSCPDPYDTASLTPGQTVTGLTTVNGTTPEQFRGTYSQTIANGIGPGLDLPVFTFEGSRITKPDGTIDAGIWAGMSGSPVYDDATGRLVGAVSYGFSTSPSNIAGVTPAAYMYDLQNPKYSSTLSASSTAKISSADRSAMQAASAGSAPIGDRPHILRPQRQVTGASAATANKAASRSPLLRSKSAFKNSGFRGGVSQTRTPVDYPIVVGGNLATSFSYGEITTSAVGTVTAICHGKVIGFGHPDEFTGNKLPQTFHGASAVMVQPDAFTGSYKIANVGKVKGVINQDRVQGILGTLGQVPSTAKVVSVSTGLGDRRVSTTDVSVPIALPYVVASQVTSDAVTLLNQNSEGEALMTWSINYTRNGAAKVFKRAQRYSTTVDFPETVSTDAASDVEALLDNEFDDRIKISKVSISSAFNPDYRAYRVSAVQYRKSGAWRSVPRGSAIPTRRGATLKLRLTLTAAKGSDAAPTSMVVKRVMSKSARRSGSLTFTGLAAAPVDEDEDFGFEEGGDEPASFTELLAMLQSQVRGDSIAEHYTYRTKHSVRQRDRIVRAPGLIKGSYKVRLKLPK